MGKYTDLVHRIGGISLNRTTASVLFSGIAFLLALFLIYIIGFAYQLFFPDMNMYLFVSLNTLLSAGLVSALYVALISKGRGFRFTSPGLSALMLLPMAVVGYFAIIAATVSWTLLLQSLGADKFISATEELIPTTGKALLISLLVVGVFPGICEEALFRGAMLPALESTWKKGPWPAIIVSGVTFGAMHGSLVGLPGHLLLGVLLGYLCWESRSIFVPMIYHTLHNSMAMVLSYGMQKVVDLTAEASSMISLDEMLMDNPAMLSVGIHIYNLIAIVAAAAFIGLLLLWRKRRRIELAKCPVSAESQAVSPNAPHYERAAGYAFIPLYIGWFVCALAYLADALITFGAISIPGL